jgi:hypothetical protein
MLPCKPKFSCKNRLLSRATATELQLCNPNGAVSEG